MDRGDLHGAGWRVSKTCEREQEKCYCWGAANEGCREERRGGVGGVKRGHTHADQKTTVLSYAQRTDAAIYLSWEWEGKREDWLLPDVEAALTPRHPSLLSSLSGAAEDCQPVQTKHKIRVLAEQVCLQLCVTCFTTLKSLSRPTCTHSQNFLSCAKTYMLTSRLAGRQAGTHTHTLPPSHYYLCGEQFCSFWCEQRGAAFCSSAAAAAAATTQDGSREEQSPPEISQQLLQLKASPCLLFSSFIFLLFSIWMWRSDADLPFPHSLPPLSFSSAACVSGTAMEDTLTCSHATFSQVFGRQGQLMQASEFHSLHIPPPQKKIFNHMHALHPPSAIPHNRILSLTAVLIHLSLGGASMRLHYHGLNHAQSREFSKRWQENKTGLSFHTLRWC